MIVKFFYIAFFLILSVLLELFLQSFGLSFPFAAFLLFYCATAFGWQAAVIGAVFGCCGLDLAVGHPYPSALPGFLLSILLSRFWLYKVESDSIFLHFIPGCIIPFFLWGGNILFHWSTFYELPSRLALLLGCSVCGMVFLPFLILVLDTLNEAMGLDLYSNAKLFLDGEKE